MASKFDKARSLIMNGVTQMLKQIGYADNEILQTGSQELCVPIVGDEAEEGYLVITFKVPKGSRDGEAYDGYAMAEDYALKQKQKEEKAKVAAEKKAKKIARDTAAREAKKKAKGE